MRTHIYGCYFTDSASIFIPYNQSEVWDSYHRFLEAVRIENTIYNTWKPKKTEIPSLESIEPILIRDHELAHYRSLVSTPFGFFLRRLLNCSSSCILHVTRKIAAEFGSNFYPDFPIYDWYLDSGKFLIKENRMKSQDWSWRDWLGRKLYEAKLYRLLASNLLSSNDITIGEFCELFNDVLSMMKVTLMLPFIPKISTNFHNNSKIIDNPDMTAASLIEAIALMAEIKMLLVLKAEKHVLEKHEIKYRELDKSYGHMYMPILDLLMKKYGPSFLSFRKIALTLDISLLGQIDPIFCLDEQNILIEDIHPILRMFRLIPKIIPLKEESLDEARIDKTIKEIYYELGWPNPKQLAGIALKYPSYGGELKKASLKTYKKKQGDFLDDDFHKDMHSQLLKGLELRDEFPEKFAFSQYRTPLLYFPLIQYFNDSSHIVGFQLGRKGQENLFFLLLHNLLSRYMLTYDQEDLSLTFKIAQAFSISTIEGRGYAPVLFPKFDPIEFAKRHFGTIIVRT